MTSPAVRPRAWALAALVSLAACGDTRPRPSGVLITLDTTNPGALDVYGRNRGLTPAIAAFASESLVFEHARATAPLTLPSHTSMMTGLVPLRHGVRSNGPVPLAPEAFTLAERARASGFQTAAFVAARVLASTFGLDQGFDVYDEPVHPAAAGKDGQGVAGIPERPAAEITRAALAWLAARDRTRPFFLWVHYFDAHAPYEPERADLLRAGGNAYLGEVAGVDREVGRLLEALRADPGFDRLLVVLVADHGEALGRHGERSHAVLCYDATIHVPLIVHFPDGRGAGQRSDAVASVADVHPTFASALGLGPARTSLDGLDLAADVPAERGVYFESYEGFLDFGWSPLAGWADARGKYLAGSRPELYAPREDPGETRDLSRRRPDEVARYRDAIARIAALPRLATRSDQELDADLAADLRALGYAGSVEAESDLPEPLDDTGLPPPQDRMDELAAYYDATDRIAAGDTDGAISILQRVAQRNPRSARIREHLATELMAAGRYEEALSVMAELRALGRDRPALREHEAACRRALGRE